MSNAGSCDGSLNIAGIGDPPSRGRSATSLCAIDVSYNTPMEASASYNKSSGAASISQASGYSQSFRAEAGSAVGNRSGAARRDSSMVQMLNEDNTPCTNGNPAFMKLAQKDGTEQKFSVQTGKVVSMKTSSGAFISRESYDSNVRVQKDFMGQISSMESPRDGMLKFDRTSTKLTVSHYSSAQMSAMKARGGSALGASPSKAYSYEWDHASRTMNIVNTEAGKEPVYITRKVVENMVIITKGLGDDRIVTTYERNYLPEGCWQEIKTVRGINDSHPTSCVRTVKRSTEGGWLTISKTQGYGSPLAQTTTYRYNDQFRLSMELKPNGGYTMYSYDAMGRPIVESSPWADGTYEKITRTTYGNLRFNDYRPATETICLRAKNGEEMQIKQTEYTYEDTPQINRITTRVTALGAVGVRLSVEETYGENALNEYSRGRIKMKQDEQGIQQHYTYEDTNAHGATWKVTSQTQVNGATVPGQSKRSIAYLDIDETVIREEEHVHTGNEWSLISTADHEYDDQKRRTKTTRGNGRTRTTQWGCSGPLEEIDEDGVKLTYGYNTARHLVEVIRSATETTPETITSYVQNASGRTLKSRRDIGAMTATKTMSYDILGRMVTETDELGRTTSRAYSADGLTTTRTTPSGATFMTTKNTDGSLFHEYGTGQRELYHVDDVADGHIRKTVKLADQTTILAQTLQNGMGETTAVISPTTAGNLYDRTTYNNKGQVTQTVRDTGNGAGSLAMAPTLYEYDTFGNITKETWKLADTPDLSNSKITTYAYSVQRAEDGIYRVITTTKNNAQGTTYQEVKKELISHLSPVLESKTVTIDPRGNASTKWTEYGQQSAQNQEKGSVRIRKLKLPTSSITASATVVDGLETKRTDTTGVTLSQNRTYTDSGLRLTQLDARGNASVTWTDIVGRTISQTDAEGNTTTTEYDTLTGNPFCITDALGKTACYAYDARGRKTAEWGTGIQPAAFAYDDDDRLIALTTWRAKEEHIIINPTGRTDGDTTTWNYHNASGLLTRKTYQDGTHENYQYNALNITATKTDAREIVTTYTLDTKQGYCTNIEFSDGTPTQNFTYDNIGNICKIIDSSGTRNITYNRYNERETDGMTVNGYKHTITETMDTFGRSTGYVLGKDAATLDIVAYAYNPEGRIAKASFLHAGQEQAFEYSYLPGTHLLHTLAHPNGVVMTRSYEQGRELAISMNATRGETDVVLRGYTYDQLGRPVTRTCSRKATTRSDSFAYNDRSELASASLGTDQYTYAYDNIGNRKTALETAQEAAQALTTYATNPLNQYSGITRGEETPFIPEYDAAGNQTKVKTTTGIWLIAYDANNRPTSFTSENGQTVVTCGYDYMGRRFMKKVTLHGNLSDHQFYLYRGYLQIAALDMKTSGTPTLWHTHWDPTEPVATRPLSVRKSGTWYTYGHDLTKNVTELYNSQGEIATTYDYTPYGAVTAAGIDQPFQWSGEVYDAELGMVYYNYRHYNPADGRWIGREPLKEKGDFNLYGFSNNQTSYFIDFLGAWKLPYHRQFVTQALDDIIKRRPELAPADSDSYKKGLSRGSTLPDNPINSWWSALPPCFFYKVGQTYNSHYGCNQWKHAMNSSGMTPEEIRDAIIDELTGINDERKGGLPDPVDLGNALHSIADSFSPSHTERNRKGEITQYNDYSEQDSSEHSKYDETYSDKSNPLKKSQDKAYEAAQKATTKVAEALMNPNTTNEQIRNLIQNDIMKHSPNIKR